MNKEEIQALREKHRNKNGNCAECCFEWIDEWQTDHFSTKYPCDVIKVLDAWEEQEGQLLNIIHNATAITHADSLEAMRRLLNVDTPEPVSETDPKLCDHWVGTIGEGEVLLYSDWQHEPQMWDFTYCPKCGEKL